MGIVNLFFAFHYIIDCRIMLKIIYTILSKTKRHISKFIVTFWDIDFDFLFSSMFSIMELLMTSVELFSLVSTMDLSCCMIYKISLIKTYSFSRIWIMFKIDQMLFKNSWMKFIDVYVDQKNDKHPCSWFNKIFVSDLKIYLEI